METLVSVVMGSRSDWRTMKYVADTLADMSVSHEVRIVSARRTPAQLDRYAESAEERGIKLIIVSAGGAAQLPELIASKTDIPVLSVPLKSTSLNGTDSFLSIVQMPSGVPVSTQATGRAGAVTVALRAASMLADYHDPIRKALINYRQQQPASAINLSDPLVAA